MDSSEELFNHTKCGTNKEWSVPFFSGPTLSVVLIPLYDSQLALQQFPMNAVGSLSTSISRFRGLKSPSRPSFRRLVHPARPRFATLHKPKELYITRDRRWLFGFNLRSNQKKAEETMGLPSAIRFMPGASADDKNDPYAAYSTVYKRYTSKEEYGFFRTASMTGTR